jgi:misacylated tRNA(Ala) deacylase
MTTQTPTTLLYATDSYLSGFTAHVVAIDGRAVALDQTAFYPGGGGQMADHGALILLHDGRHLAVSGMSKRDGVVWHELAGDVGDPPTVGAQVAGEIDWPFRYTMMRTHTALHLLCGLIFS